MLLIHQIRRLAIGLFPALISIPAMAQVDTEFWFVAPEVWANHGDSPTLLRFATFDEDATVTVEQPANPGFPTQTLNIAQYSHVEHLWQLISITISSK
jgi:hypothetical protein